MARGIEKEKLKHFFRICYAFKSTKSNVAFVKELLFFFWSMEIDLVVVEMIIVFSR